MKKSMWLKRGAAVAVFAGLLGAALPAGAYAATIDYNTVLGTGEGAPTGSSTLIEKTWDAPLKSDDEVFSFEFNYDPTESTASEAPSQTTFTASTERAMWANNVKGKVRIADAFKGVDFPVAGIYAFDVRELVPAKPNPNCTYSTQTFTVLVHVDQNDGNPVVNEIAVKNSDGTKTQMAQVVNTGATDPGTLTFKNTVAGGASSKDDEFTYYLKLTGNCNGNYPCYVYNADGSEADWKLVTPHTNKGQKLVLKDGQYAVVENLPQGTEWTVTMDDNAGYDSTALSSADLESASDSVDNATRVATGTIIAKDTDTVNYESRKDSALAMGVSSDIAPFALAGAAIVAGGATLVISRRHARENF